MDSYNQINPALEKEWDELVIKASGSIYLTCAWSRIWWEIYGKYKILRIFFFRSKGKLVGVIPTYIDKIRIGCAQTRIARLVGANNPPRVFDLPVIKEYAADIGENLVNHLVGIDGCDLISIGPVSDECEAKKVLFAAVEKKSDELGIVRNVPFGVYTYFKLPDAFDAYMQTLSNNERKSRRYYEKLLSKEHDIHFLAIHEPDKIEEEMQRFIALHTEQWRQQGRPGYFSAWPQSDAFNLRLAVEQAHLGRIALIKITAGEKPIIYEYRYIFGDCCYWQLSARAAGEEWDRFSLGATGVVVLIRTTIENGIKRIEGGLSHYDYKIRLGATESNVSILRLIARRPSSISKYYICLTLHNFLLNFYYKLWYSRIQPKLPSLFRRPICMAYIRLTF
jgi:hypothetical protein